MPIRGALPRLRLNERLWTLASLRSILVFMRDTVPHDLAEKAAAMQEFRRLREAGLPVPTEVRERHLWATNDGYATGPNPGQRIPDFALPDQFGTLRGLNDLAGPYGLLLVFHRSADW